MLDPDRYQLIPRIAIVPRRLLLLGFPVQVDRIQPPHCASLVLVDRLGPKLVAVAAEFINPNLSTQNRPEPPAAGFIPQICGVIDRSGEYALPRGFDQPLTVWRSEAISGPRHERLDLADFGARHGIQFGNFDNPRAAGLETCILTSEFGQFVCE